MRKNILFAAMLVISGHAHAGWEASETEDKLTGQKSPFIMLKAEDTSVNPVGFPVIHGKEGLLMVSCNADKVVVMYLVAGRPMSRQGTVLNFRIDKEAPSLKQPWSPSSTGEGLGIFLKNPAAEFVNKISKASTLFVRSEDKIFGMTEATFNLDGVATALAPLRSECNF
ncbi:MAG: Type secretion system VasI, EvfG [Hyphomicrobiales bacterium]|nr:Type secretion system VasI, EvfG [Hyphomicrobiales bacterium]